MTFLLDGQDKLDSILGLVPCGVIHDEHIREALREMYELCAEHPGDYLWHTNWQIILKAENISIGSIGFKGPPNAGHGAEVGYGINKAYQNKGFATEALTAMINWAFSQQNVYYIQAHTEAGNDPSKKVLEKCGFKLSGEGLLYEKEKAASAWMAVYMCIGMSTGMSIGAAMGNISIGMCLGMSMGIAVGTALDAQDKKNRKR
jgi:RimJ/RimL family protein N-acetyltransferase